MLGLVRANYLSIMMEDRRRAVGLASPLPACTLSVVNKEIRIVIVLTSNVRSRSVHSFEDGRVLGKVSTGKGSELHHQHSLGQCCRKGSSRVLR